MTEQTTHYNGDLDTDVSLEVWELTLPEDEAKCEQPEARCLNAAEWLRTPPCGHARQVCDPHRLGSNPLSTLGICLACGRVCDVASVRWHRI